ncbi:CinA family protein [Candidatus Saganbacteria bacterium]|nr:CinA family protein [Candidatus Saganbacteria bacterium]
MAEPNVKKVALEDFSSKVLSMIGKITDQQISDLLRKSGQTIAAAESLTGGLIAARLTDTAGSSEFFIGGIVCYHTRIKVVQLGVPAALISQYGVVSKEIAESMAENIRQKFHTDIGLASTGAAGPAPLPPAPVGRAYIALAANQGSECRELNLSGSRQEIREKAVQAALGLLWFHLGGSDR